MTLDDAQQIMDKCVEIHTTSAKMIPSWMKITISISCQREAVQKVYNNILKPFDENRQFAAGEVIHYKGVRLILEP